MVFLRRRSTLYEQRRTSRQMSFTNFSVTFSLAEECKRPLSLSLLSYRPSSIVLITIWVSSASTTAFSRKKSLQSPGKCFNQSKSSSVKKEMDTAQKKLLVSMLNAMKWRSSDWQTNSVITLQRYSFVRYGSLTPGTLAGRPETSTEMFWWVTWRYIS